MATDVKYDVVLLGATGFTGRLVAERLAAEGPAGLTWAIAGRDKAKLDAVAESLGGGVDIVLADLGDAGSLRRMAEQAKVVATTVGPYMSYGEPLVAACADTGTDYADLCGEPEFVDRMWLAHHARAVQTGARLVHACGFDSIPHDLGAWFTVRQLPDDAPITLSGFVRASGAVSGGTYHSAIRGFSRIRQSGEVAATRRKAESAARVASGRRVGSLPRKPVRSPDGRGWGLPLPTIDPVVVRRSARALDEYGPDFRYGHYALVRSLPMAVAAPAVLGGMVAVAQLPPGRDLLLRLRAQGSGPPPEQRAKSWFKVRFYGEAAGQRVVTEVSGGDPGYGETATMLAESALCLAFDDAPDAVGQLTTVQAMAGPLLGRLQARGISFKVVHPE